MAEQEDKLVDENNLPPDPLEEAVQQVETVVSRPPLRVFLIVLFVLIVFVVGASLTEIIGDLAKTWVHNEVLDFLSRSSVSNGCLIVFAFVAAFLLIYAIYNHRRYQKEQEISNQGILRIQALEEELENRSRQLDHYRDYSEVQRQIFRDLTDELDERSKREAEVLSVLNDVMLTMIRTLCDKTGTEIEPAEALYRFFVVCKSQIPHLFSNAIDIRNICIIEPKGDFLYPSSKYRLYNPPQEVAEIEKYYIGDDTSKQNIMRVEGRLYKQINQDDGNIRQFDPIVVYVDDREEGLLESHGEKYISFYKQAGLYTPYYSYILIPIGHHWGILRIESDNKDTFGESHYTILKEIAAILNLAFSIVSWLAFLPKQPKRKVG